MPAPTTRAVLDVIARHQAHRSVKALATLAGIDGGNLHSSLAGRRPMAGDTLRCVAAAVGLQLVTPATGDARLEPAPATVLHLAVDVDGLDQLVVALREFASGALAWRLVLPAEPSARPDAVAGLAVARYPGAYVVVHLAGSQAQVRAQADTLCERLGGVDPEQPAPEVWRDVQWIRLRAGLVGVPELNEIFGVAAAPSGADWGRMLTALSLRGFTPAAVMTRFAAGAQVIYPGPSKEIWDAALIRSGLDPADMAVYNVTSFNRAADADTPTE